MTDCHCFLYTYCIDYAIELFDLSYESTFIFHCYIQIILLSPMGGWITFIGICGHLNNNLRIKVQPCESGVPWKQDMLYYSTFRTRKLSQYPSSVLGIYSQRFHPWVLSTTPVYRFWVLFMNFDSIHNIYLNYNDFIWI